MTSSSVTNPLIPAAWHARTPDAAPTGTTAPTLALVHSDRGTAASRLREAGLTIGDVVSDLRQGIVLRLRSDQVIVLCSPSHRLLLKQDDARHPGYPTLFIMAIDPRGPSDPPPTWRPGDVLVSPPWSAASCDVSMLLAFQDEARNLESTPFAPPELPAWLGQRTALTSTLEHKYGPLRVLLQTLRDRESLGLSDAVRGTLADIGQEADEDVDSAPALLVIALAADTDADDLDTLVRGQRVELSASRDDGQPVPGRVVGEVHQSTRTHLWVRSRSAGPLEPGMQIRVRGTVDFDRSTTFTPSTASCRARSRAVGRRSTALLLDPAHLPASEPERPAACRSTRSWMTPSAPPSRAQ